MIFFRTSFWTAWLDSDFLVSSVFLPWCSIILRTAAPNFLGLGKWKFNFYRWTIITFPFPFCFPLSDAKGESDDANFFVLGGLGLIPLYVCMRVCEYVWMHQWKHLTIPLFFAFSIGKCRPLCLKMAAISFFVRLNFPRELLWIKIVYILEC